MSEKINYTGAFDELQTIVLEIEQGEISVDDLSEKVKRSLEVQVLMWPMLPVISSSLFSRFQL